MVGGGGYALAKRVVGVGWRRRLLQAHEWTVRAGVGLTVPHPVSVGELEGFGVLVALLLGIEVTSGLYGRHLHRPVVRLGRGEEAASLVGRALDATKRTVGARWRRVHVTLTLLTLVALAIHVVTAVGE